MSDEERAPIAAGVRDSAGVEPLHEDWGVEEEREARSLRMEADCLRAELKVVFCG